MTDLQKAKANIWGIVMTLFILVALMPTYFFPSIAEISQKSMAPASGLLVMIFSTPIFLIALLILNIRRYKALKNKAQP